MKTLRVVENFTLVDSGEDISLRYYIDDGEEVSAHFDEFEMLYLLAISDEAFVRDCIPYFV